MVSCFQNLTTTAARKIFTSVGCVWGVGVCGVCVWGVGVCGVWVCVGCACGAWVGGVAVPGCYHE